MIDIHCQTCGGVEAEDTCVCQYDERIVALEEENTRLRRQLAHVTRLIGDVLEYCETCRTMDNPECARCQSFRAWLEAST
jgi:hypothetical protein